MVMAHELVHVYLMYLFDQDDLLTYYPDYNDLNDAFQDFQNNPSSNSENVLQDSMHNVYDDFLDWITDAVYIYATDNNISGITENYCNQMVIGHHQNTETFQSLTSAQKTEYSTIAENEQNGNNGAKGRKCE
jgi:hypothetical protein